MRAARTKPLQTGRSYNQFQKLPRLRSSRSYTMLEKSEKETLFKAAERDDIETVKRFVEEKNVPVTVTNDQGQTLAHVAVGKNGLDIVEYVLEKNSSVLAALDSGNYSVLHLAVEKGDIDVVKYLCEEHDANIMERNRRDLARSAIHTAVQFGHLNILKYFVDERGVDVNMPDEWIDKPPVFLALQYRHRDVLDYLVEEKKADLSPVDFFGENILFVALRAGDLDFMKRVLDEKGLKFDVNGRNQNNETLAYKAVFRNQTDILKYLVEKKRADVNIPEKWDRLTCLHVAASRNDFKLCKYLIAHGARMRMKDRSGKTAVQKATDPNLVEYMESIAVKIRNSRSADYESFQPITTMKSLYEAARRRLGRDRSAHEVDCFGADAEIAGGNVFLSLFSIVAESLAANAPARLLGLRSSLSPQRTDPVAEDVLLFEIFRYE